MKCKSKLYSLYSVLLAFVLLLSPMSSIGSQASTTSGSVSEEIFEYTEDYVRDNFDAICRYVTKWYAIVSDSVIGTWQDFEDWLDSSGNGDVWTQHPHSPIRVENNVEVVDVPQPVLQIVLNYMQERVNATDRGYTECYLYSYNFLSPSAFSTYQQYITTKEYLKNSEGRYSVILLSQGNIMVSQYLNQSQNLGFVGTTSYGTFTSVQPYVNWSTLGQNMLTPNATINSAGTMSQNVNTNWYGYSNLKNTATPNGSNKIIMSPNEKNELVYVFKTLNAYKNYNAGLPQPYYMTSEGMTNSNWTVGSGTINTGTLSTANNTYNSVVNNVQSGWTADEVLELVNMISNNASNGNGSGNGSGSDNDGWLDLGIFGDIGKAIAKILGGIIEAIVTVFTEIIGIITNVSETLLQGVIFDFLSALLGWLPEEIIAVITALFSIAVLFALIKLIREAF